MDDLYLGLAEYQAEQEGRRIIAARAAELGLQVRDYLHLRAERARLRQRAETYGLAYWPALYVRGCDPRAYVIAERILARRTGALWGERLPDGRISHGGWDSQGHHGPSAADVRRMWFAAGCRDGAKFRLQVAGDIVARKGDTVPWLRAYIRGLRWLSGNRIRLPLGRKAIAALGRMSPEVRRAALTRHFGAPPRPGVVLRIRDLDWAAARRAQDAMRGGSVRARAALAGVRRAAALLGLEYPAPQAIAARLAPAYPNLTLPLARRVALGESPRDLAGGQLTRAEAHAWATAGAPEITGWLADHLGLPAHRSIRVLRWLERCRQSGRWAALERERIARVPGEQHARRYSALEVLDEIQDEDIVTGGDSVDAVLQRAAQRLGDAWLTAQMADHRILAPLPAWARELPRGVRLLRTAAELATEGRDMGHCVAGYAGAVERGQCHILAIRSRQGRSTVELLPDLTVAQHRAERNAAPPARHATLLRALLARIQRIAGGRRAA